MQLKSYHIDTVLPEYEFTLFHALLFHPLCHAIEFLQRIVHTDFIAFLMPERIIGKERGLFHFKAATPVPVDKTGIITAKRVFQACFNTRRIPHVRSIRAAYPC